MTSISPDHSPSPFSTHSEVRGGEVSEKKVDPKTLENFRQRRSEARQVVLNHLQNATDLSGFVTCSQGFRDLQPGNYEWVLGGGDQYAEYINATAADWIRWATEPANPARTSQEVAKINGLVDVLSKEPKDPDKVRIVVGRFPSVDYPGNDEYRIAARLPVGSDFLYDIPRTNPRDDQEDIIYLTPATGCTDSALYHIFDGKPADSQFVSIDIQDVDLDSLRRRLAGDALISVIHYDSDRRKGDSLYDWYYVLFGVKGGFSNEHSLLVSDFHSKAKKE